MFWRIICAIALANANFVPMERVGPTGPIVVGDPAIYRVISLSEIEESVTFKALSGDEKEKKKSLLAAGWIVEREGTEVRLYPLKPGHQVSPEIGVFSESGVHLFTLSPVSVEVMPPGSIEEQKLVSQLKSIPYPIEVKVALLILSLMLLAVLLWGVVRWSRRMGRRHPPESVIAKPKNADQRLLSAIQEVRQKRLWEKESFRKIFMDLSQVFKEFLSERYAISAIDFTSYEILEALRPKIVALDDLDALERVLREMDYIKFSNTQTSDEGALEVLSQLESWVVKKRRGDRAV